MVSFFITVDINEYNYIGDIMIPKKYIIFLFIISICTIQFVKATNTELKTDFYGKVIYIDAGHGGIDSGAVYKNILEKDINLSISKLLALKLEYLGATVYLTRDGDYDLSVKNAFPRKRSDLGNRAKLINNSGADIYLSIHLNATTSSVWRGAQVFFDDINTENKKIAQYVQQELNKGRYISEIKGMYMNSRIKIPGVLIEAGFLSNDSDRNLLVTEEYQEEIVDKIINGLDNYFSR